MAARSPIHYGGSILGPLVSPAFMRLLDHHVLTTGFAALAVSCVASMRVVPALPFYAGLALAGVGHGVVLPSIVRIVIGEIEPAKARLASSIVTSMLQSGSAFGATAISGVFFSAVARDGSPVGYAQAYRSGTMIVSLLFVACIALAFAMSAQARTRYNLTRKALVLADRLQCSDPFD